MPLLTIITYPNPILKQKANLVTEFDKNLHNFLDDLKETMYQADGIGLAATQVGIMQQVAVIDVSESRDQPIELVNPTLEKDPKLVPSKEGCLSIPNFKETILRHQKVTVKAKDRMGNDFSFSADGLLSFCLQHEIDHLNGILFIDHLSRLKLELFKKWTQKNTI